MTDKKLILFDFDGTVIDNSEGIINCIKYSLGKMGKPVPGENILHRFIGPSLFDAYFDYIDKNEADAQTFVDGYRERYAPLGTTEVKLYPRMKELLTALNRDGYICAVVSSKPLTFVKKIAAFLGVYELFGEYFCPDFAAHKSDKSEYVADAVEHFGVEKEQALMIGDTRFDVRAAHAAGVECLGAAYGFGLPGELEEENAEYTASSSEEIYSLITGKNL